MPASSSLRPMDWLLLGILSVLWGGSFFFSKIAVAELPPLTVVFCRVALAALVLFLFLVVSRRSLPRGRAVWTAFFGMGLLNNVIPFSLIFWGQTHIASGLAAILNATTPLFTVLVLHVLTRDETATPNKLFGVFAGLAGVALMIGPGAFAGFSSALAGELACLAAALSYAFAGFFGRRFKALGVAPIQTAFGQLTASSAMMLPVSLAIDGVPQAMISHSAAASILALAVLSTAVAYIIFFRILSTAGPTNLLLVTFLIPVSAILLGALFLSERLMPGHFAGMAMIGMGLAAIDGRLWRWLKPRFAP